MCQFLMRYMPDLSDHLSHRNLDIYTINELVARWYPGTLERLDKGLQYRSIDDIRSSIDELKFYRQRVLES